MLRLLSLVLTAGVLTLSPVVAKCSWDSCPQWSTDPNAINVHIIPHSHDDMGWLKTVDDYYSGAHPDIVDVGVQYIIDTVTAALHMNPDRKFSQCETGFLTMWWEHQDNRTRQIYKDLVASGQIEFIGGGWVQPDEAATHYIDLIDQYTLGLRKLNEHFGDCGHPKVAWQIDPFGHSREHSNLVRMMGYEGVFFWREHYLEQEMRKKEKKLDMNWKVSEDLDNTLFTRAFYDSYGPPYVQRGNDHLCWDIFCNSPPIVDDPKLNGYNADNVTNAFLDHIRYDRIPTQLHNHVFVLFGSDFQYQFADRWYSNLDKLIRHANTKTNDPKAPTNINLAYSTPTCYMKAVQDLEAAGKLNLPSKTEDFFPYANSPHEYWTGYFSSKPDQKGDVRKSSAFLQLIRQFNALQQSLNIGAGNNENLEEELERAQSLNQHHDGISGTSKHAVTLDYEKKIFFAWDTSAPQLATATEAISQAGKSNNVKLPPQTFCPLLNETTCEALKGKSSFTATVYNGNGRTAHNLIRIPIYGTTGGWTVSDSEKKPVDSEIVATAPHDNQLSGAQIAANELRFFAEVPPVGYRTYFVQQGGGGKAYQGEQQRAAGQANTISNGILTLTFDANGLLQTLANKNTGKTYNVKQELMYYRAHDNKNTGGSGRASGAYIFRPEDNAKVVHIATGSVQLDILKNKIAPEARQKFSDWATQTIRLLPGQDYVEFEWTVGPLPTDQKVVGGGVEVISRFTFSDLAGNWDGVFYTDANGRQLRKRVVNQGYDYTWDATEPIAGNYYPVNSRIFVKDTGTQMTVLTDRSQAGGSLAQGEVELLIHRRDFYDDGKGVDEPLNQPGRDGRGLVVRGRHWLTLAPAGDSSHRTRAFDIFHQPVVLFGDLTDGYDKNYLTKYSGLIADLPSNVNLLTLKRLSPYDLLVRLEHTYQNNEDSSLSGSVTVDLTKVFNFGIRCAHEVALAANRELLPGQAGRCVDATAVALSPQQIRTFVLQLGVKQETQTTTTPAVHVDHTPASAYTNMASLALLSILLVLNFVN